MRVLPLRRTVRRRPVVQVDPHRCHCPMVHHAITRVERDLTLARIDRAKASKNDDLADYLQLQLDNAAHCPAYQAGPKCPKCPCGCGRHPSEHSEPMGAA